MSEPRNCKDCGAQVLPGRRRCAAHTHVPIVCAECETTFYLIPSVVIARMNARIGGRKTDGFFCSRQCYGRQLGRRHGYGRVKALAS